MMKNFNLRGGAKTFSAVYPILIAGVIIVLLGVFLNFFFDGTVNDFVIIIFILLSFIIITFIIYLVFNKQNAHVKIQAKTLSNIINNSPIGIYTVDKDGIITSFNPKMCKISGCKDPQERIGLNVFELHSYRENNLDDHFRKGLAGEPFETEVRHVSQSGKESFRHYHGVPLFDSKNKDVAKLLLLVEDVTERKKLETQLQKYTQGLETTVTARAKELEEKIKEMTRLHDLTVDRELKMAELKKEIEELKKKLAQNKT